MTARFYLVHVELALTSGQFSVAGGKLSDKIVTADKQNIPAGLARRKTDWLENQVRQGRVKNRAYLPSLSQS